MGMQVMKRETNAIMASRDHDMLGFDFGSTGSCGVI